MKKRTLRPLALSVACLLPAAAVHAQTAGQSPQPGPLAVQPTAEPVGQYMGQTMGISAIVPVSPAQSISQPFPPVSAYPDEGEPLGLRLRARAAVERDDNVLRTSANEQSDTITSLGVGLRYNQRFGQQRVVLDAEAARFDFDNLGLDYNTLNYAGALYWRVASRWEGVVSADRRQFRDVTTNLGGIVNRRTERNEVAEANYRLGASLRLIAGVLNSQVDNTTINAWDGSPQVTSLRVGAGYESATGSSLVARYRDGDGEYRNTAAGSDFKERETELLARWVVSPKTSVNGRIGRLEREHTGAAATRDFSGTVGGINASWDATAKTRLVVGWQRDLGAYLLGTGGYQRSERFYVAPVWRITTQTALSARYERDRRTWQNVTGNAVDAGRADTFNVLALGVDWQPRRNVGVGLQYRTEERDSSATGANFRANVLGLSVRLTI